MISGPLGSRVTPRRVTALLVLMIFIFAVFAVRLVYLQVITTQGYLTAAEDNRTQRISIAPSRGVIYDRNGTLLARNVPVYNITITPAYLPDETAEVQAIYRRLSTMTGVPIQVPGSRPSRECAEGRGIEDLVQEWVGLAPYQPVKIQCDADPQVAMAIQELSAEMPGVGVQVTSTRDYPTGSVTAHIIGYLGPIPERLAGYYESLGYTLDRDRIGYAGLEAYMQEELAGTYGLRVVEVDAAGLETRLLEPPIAPVAGVNLKLTIDQRLQDAATTILLNAIMEDRATKNQLLMSPVISGSVIAMNPKTGEILAMVSIPTYDNQKFSRGIPIEYYTALTKDISTPLLNHAISGEYSPGSVFKLATAIGALQEGVVTPSDIIDCKGTISILQKFYPEDPGKPKLFYCYSWLTGGHGPVDFIRGVAESCDVYFYCLGGGFPGSAAGEGLGIWNISKYARAIGYGQRLGIELPGEAVGIIPDPDWKRINQGENWASGDTYIATIGQGLVTSTPLQVLESIAMVANDGRVMKPTLIREYLDGEGNIVKPFEPVMLWDITDSRLNDSPYDLVTVEPWVIAKLQEGMRAVVEYGTASKYARLPNVVSAGKTGTAEYCDNVAREQNRCMQGAWPTHAWYGAYAPADDPEIAIVAFVYDGGEGALIAGPIVREVMRLYFEFRDYGNPSGG